ncbi:Uncharacterised protein [Vibrio cholerae]|nr:Uncharacterised protein [Vibrio cholerae]
MVSVFHLINRFVVFLIGKMLQAPIFIHACM